MGADAYGPLSIVVARYRSVRAEAPSRMYEFVVLVILIAIFIGVAGRQIWKLRVAAEQVVVEQLVGAVRAGLGEQVAYTVMQEGQGALMRFDRANPVDFLREPPPNYELLDAETATRERLPYRWYFDPRERVLSYVVANTEYVEGATVLRFQIQVRFADRNGDGRFDPRTDSMGNVSLVTLEPYRWSSAEE